MRWAAQGRTAVLSVGSVQAVRRAISRATAFGVSLTILLVGNAAFGQSPAPLAQPNVSLYLNGTVQALAAQPDGGVVFGGSFTSVNGVARGNLARLLPDGSLDASWNPVVDGVVKTLAVNGSGAVYVGGQFTEVGGQPRDNLAKLNADGSLVASWAPSANDAVSALAIDASGWVYAGGDFTQITGSPRSHLAKLDGGGSGAIDPNWNPAPDAAVDALALAGSADLYVGGDFGNVGGQTRARIAKLTTSGSGSADATWNPGADGTVRALAFDAHGALFAGGDFSSMGGQVRHAIAKLSLSGSGSADALWNPDADNSVFTLTVDATNGVYAGGNFAQIGGAERRFIAKLSATGSGSADASWAPTPNSSVLALALMQGGVLYTGGTFNRIDADVHLSLAAISPGGSAAESATDAEQNGYAYAVATQSDGGILVGGNFEKADQAVRSNILRLRSDGTLDTLWDPSANGYVLALATDPDGSVYAGGYFNFIGGQSRASIAKLSGSGTGAADPNWNPSADDIVRSLAVGAGGTVYAGGRFAAIGGQLRSNIAKLGPGGLADANWNPGANGTVAALAIDPAGIVYAGGEFTLMGGVVRNRLAKLGGAGTVDATWNPSADDSINSLALAGSSALYVGGNFNNVAGQLRSHIVKVQTAGAGGVDASWNPSANGVVRALALDSTGALFAGGGFSSIGGQTRNAIAKLAGTGTGAADPLWNPAADFYVDALAVTSNHAVVVGGEFSEIGGQPRLGLAALTPSNAPIAQTTTGIDSVSPATTVTGQIYTVSFHVTAPSGTPIGTVDVRDDAGASCGPVTLSAGSGACALASLSAGTRLLTASFTPGDVGDFSVSEAQVTHMVQQAQTTLALTAHVPDPSTPSQAVAITVALAVSAPGSGTPSGNIVVSDGIDTCSVPQGATSCSVALTTRGSRTLTAIYAGDANFTASTASATHHVNRLPIATGDSYATNEDTALTIAVAQGLLANDSDPDGDSLTVTNTGTFAASGIGGVVQLNANGSFVYTPPADLNGVAGFSYTLSDGRETTIGNAVITVVAINDPPSFTLAANPSLPAGTQGAGSVPAFAVVTRYGPPDEANQATSAWLVRAIADPSGAVPQASIQLDGTLDYTTSGQPGTATFGVKLQDNGGTANGGIDTSAEQIFSITVAAGADLSISIDDGVGFVRGGQSVHYTIVVANGGPNDVIGARVRDLLPINLTGAQWTCTADTGAACAASGSGNIDDLASIPSGKTATYSLTAIVVAIPEQPLINAVTVDAPSQTPDDHLQNNSASDTDAVGIFADGFEQRG